MKIISIILLAVCLSCHTKDQDIKSLDQKPVSKRQATIDSIESLNLLARGLTFVNPLKALDYSNKALELSTKIDYPTGKGYAYRNLSSVYSYDESYFVSMDYLQQALDIFTLINDSVGIANCYISVGHTYRRLQNRKEEIEYNEKAYTIFKRLDDKERIGVATHNLGESYYNIGDLINSRKLTIDAIRINDSINNKSVLSSCFKVMGLIELKEKNISLAETYFHKVLDIAAQLGENSQKIATAESLLQLATINKLKGDFENQLKFLLMTSQFSFENNLPSYLQKSYQELILFSSIKGDQKLVQQYIRSYQTISDSLNQRQLRDRYNLTKSIVQAHELYKSKNKLEELNLLQSQKIRSRNTLLIVVVISAMFLLWILLKYINLTKKLENQNSIIESQKNDLEVLNNTKDKFFSIVAHDLKSPLNSLKSFSSLIIEHFDQLNKEEILNMSHQLRASVDNTIKMADNLITWARLQMKDHQYKEEEIRIKDLTSNICEVYRDVALKKEIKLICSVEDSLTVIGDKNQIEFVLRNLLNNAIKFTHKGGTVKLSAQSLTDGHVQISVADNGIGISNDLKNKLFAVGKKQSTNGTDGEKGTGLGLILSYEFVKLNGGKIDIESELGEGTTFHIIFKSGALPMTMNE